MNLADALQVLDSNIVYAPTSSYAEVARVVNAELDRLRAVEKAAAALVEHLDLEGHAHDLPKAGRRAWIDTRDRLEDKLRTAVKGGWL